jgi:hypothetical protein
MSIDPTENTDDTITIDELASRLIDRDLALSDIPSDLRAVVESRAAQFEANRKQLLTPLPQADGSTIDDAIHQALRSNQTQPVTRAKSRKFGVYIGSLAAAAACVAIVGVAVTRSDTDDRSSSTVDASAKVASGDAAAFEAQLATQAPAADESTEMSAASFAPAASDPAASDMAPADASGAESPASMASTQLSPVVLWGLDDLNSLITSWNSTGLQVPIKPSPLCDDPLRPAVDIEARLLGDPVEIHFTSQDGVVLYRISDCSVKIGIVP